MRKLFHGGLTVVKQKVNCINKKNGPPRSRSGTDHLLGGRYWVRTSDLFGVNEARYHCANRPNAIEC
jgi:hypothetical protein